MFEIPRDPAINNAVAADCDDLSDSKSARNPPYERSPARGDNGLQIDKAIWARQ